MQINWINFSIFESLKGGAQKIRSNFDLKILCLLIKSKTSSRNIYAFFFTFNFSIFFSNIFLASLAFSTKQTLPACLYSHSNPNDPVPAYKSKIFDFSN